MNEINGKSLPKSVISLGKKQSNSLNHNSIKYIKIINFLSSIVISSKIQILNYFLQIFLNRYCQAIEQITLKKSKILKKKTKGFS